MRIGLLDYGLNDARISIPSFYEKLLDHVRAAESLGFTRYWLTEHQSSVDAWATQALPIMWLAQQTKSILFGSAGVLLDYHSPLEVACDFNLLEHLYPGRIELGVARGKPFQPNAAALRNAETHAEFPERLGDLMALFAEQATDEKGRILPLPCRRPTLWTLGTSDISMELALRHGLNYAHSIFHPFPIDLEPIRRFTEKRASHNQRAILTVAGLCAPSQLEADRRVRNNPHQNVVPTVTGDAQRCRSLLELLLSESSADEIVFLDVSPTHAYRQESMHLLSSLL